MNKICSFKSNVEQFNNDCEDVLRSFYPHLIFDNTCPDFLYLSVGRLSDRLVVEIDFDGDNYKRAFDMPEDMSPLIEKRLTKRYAKLTLYYYLSEKLSKKLPYGALTGIRPTKLYYELCSEGMERELIELFGVSEKKYKLITEIVKAQEGIYGQELHKADFFINIPFCPTRCSYCSFISETVARAKQYLSRYVECLKQEIKQGLDYLDSHGIGIRSVYIGGGTPTALSANDLLELLACFKGRSLAEFTVEAGRPDTIDSEKLSVLSDLGVSRVSINPQTFSDKTLGLIGRAHTKEDVFKAYELTRRFPFDINMDLIAALPQERVEDFKYSCDTALSLKPDNITIHTLALKKGSVLKVGEYDNTDADTASSMVDYGYTAVTEHGYRPYYMYRQKYMSGNLENVGYAKTGKESVYNIDIMEETHNIIACGAGAISKGYFGVGRLERFAFVKNISQYVERIDELLEKKEKYLKNLLFFR